jgi:hypothetical protein
VLGWILLVQSGTNDKLLGTQKLTIITIIIITGITALSGPWLHLGISAIHFHP